MIKRIIASLLCVALCGFCACSDSEDKPAEKAEVGTNVTVYKVMGGDIESVVSYTGTLTASESVSVSAKVSAKAQNVLVKEGDYVNAGATLVQLDNTDLALGYQQALAAYNSAVAGYNAVVNSSTKQQSAQANQALINAQTAYDQAKANYEREKVLYENASQVKLAKQAYDDAKANYERIKQLFDMGGASQLEVDNAYSSLISAEENYKTVNATASAAFEASKTALTNAENALNNARENVNLTAGATDASIETALASVNSAKAALDIASNNLNNTTVRAPISGYVSVCNVSRGQMVAAGSPIYEIKNANIMDVEINVTDSVIPLLSIGTKANISILSAQIENIEGFVSMIDPIKDDMTGLYKVKISIDNSEELVNVGMVADISLTTASLSDITKIPSEALINEGEAYYVYVSKGNIAEKRMVTVGVTDDIYTEIISGVDFGDEIIIEGKDYLSDENNEIIVTGEWSEE
ncbi:MAG: efflux RND transporter periplasmic adaptor subunit [Clostridia bacterium]|nr:efflux RND transporter periplasmic adaptor subunit [Clostridia bacterium]